jgi:hypothetical protein
MWSTGNVSIILTLSTLNVMIRFIKFTMYSGSFCSSHQSFALFVDQSVPHRQRSNQEHSGRKGEE